MDAELDALLNMNPRRAEKHIVEIDSKLPASEEYAEVRRGLQRIRAAVSVGNRIAVRQSIGETKFALRKVEAKDGNGQQPKPAAKIITVQPGGMAGSGRPHAVELERPSWLPSPQTRARYLLRRGGREGRRGYAGDA